MEQLRALLAVDPCHEQHIVAIKEIYEDSLFSILIPAIYEGFLSIYKNAHDIELKFIEAIKKRQNVENPGILIIFQTLIKEIPNLNNHKIRNETDRIKSSTKTADLFDDLIKAVAKSNIILMTYNVDHKRKDLLQNKYHENIITYDFIHRCYIQSARNFYGCVELFWHKHKPLILNKNKRSCFKIIQKSIRESIRIMLPMKEILLEYLTQKYEQKDRIHYINIPGMSPDAIDQANQTGQIAANDETMLKHFGGNQEEYAEVNDLIQRDLQNAPHDSLLMESDSNDNEADNNIGGFSQLINNTDEFDDMSDQKIDTDGSASFDTNTGTGTADTETNTKSEGGTKMVDISGIMNGRGPSKTFFNEIMPDIKKSYNKYKDKRNSKTATNDIEITRIPDTKTHDKTNSNVSDAVVDDVSTMSTVSVASAVTVDSSSDTADDIVDNILK